jgi:hypothetical protein
VGSKHTLFGVVDVHDFWLFNPHVANLLALRAHVGTDWWWKEPQAWFI